MKAELEKQHVLDWHRLKKERAEIDHEFARLCFEIRRDAGSDDEAVKLITVKCGESGREARAALVRARAYEAVQSAETWRAIGGFASARLIATELTTKRQRAVVLTEAAEAASKAGRPIGEKKVRDIAWRRGFISKETPSATAARERTELLADLRRLLNSGVIQLSQLSASVRALVKPPKERRMAA